METVMGEDAFNHNPLVEDAVVFNLLQIGELSYKKLRNCSVHLIRYT